MYVEGIHLSVLMCVIPEIYTVGIYFQRVPKDCFKIIKVFYLLYSSVYGLYTPPILFFFLVLFRHELPGSQTENYTGTLMLYIFGNLVRMFRMLCDVYNCINLYASVHRRCDVRPRKLNVSHSQGN